ncbi:hypothetical protein K9M79_04890 [Candidatus Woesearchaeota archaeon]|nr:hypothetical protein [Candidatus Woesearchaeota archaeon]
MEKNITITGNCVQISINPKLYPIEVIYSASYVFLDKYYILLDEDHKKNVLVHIKPKKNKSEISEDEMEALAGDFLNELINYADYNVRAKQTQKIREMLIQRSIITNDPEILKNDELNDEEFNHILDKLDEDYDEFLDDPKEIAIPWEEKYGNKTKDK